MRERLRPVEARRLVSFLIKQGFAIIGQTGSHLKLRRGNEMLVVPMHARQPVKPGLVLKILKQAGVDPHAALDDL
ncbi:MAG TPA: type II toxin-antitoxin system HicA family toxin [Candidatus Thermoplasmatota archaeon]|nr:type II toxin-antitoxin system HicA family toxin [Candidatus Thermoplasmatota archaeon]